MKKGWKEITVGDLGQVITGNTPPRKRPELYGAHTIFVKPTDILKGQKFCYSPEECYSDLGFTKYKKSLIPKGATCVVTIGSIGEKMILAHQEMFINQAMNAVIPSSEYDEQFVYYLLKLNLFQLKTFDSGTASGRENVSKSSFSNIKVNVPESLPTQRKIAAILSAYDDLIENNLRRIRLLEELAQRTYEEWFVRLKFPGHENTPVDQETGLPVGWREVAMNDIGEYLNGYAFKPKHWGSKGLPIIKIKEMKNGITNETPRCPLEKIPVKYHVKRGDILFSWSASLSVVLWTEEEGLLNQHLFKVTPKSGFGNSFVYLSCLYCIPQFTNLTTGSTMKHIKRGELKNVFVSCPDSSTMKRFEKKVQPTLEAILNLTRQNRLLREARDILLPRLMTGRVRV